MKPDQDRSYRLAAEITRNSSTQTYYTIRLLADRALVPDAYRAYAYFRWVDDILDGDSASPEERSTFIRRQQHLLDACYARRALKSSGGEPGAACPEEQMLVDLVAADREPSSGLQSYLRSMMAVMAFDAGRRGRPISQMELSAYSRLLSTAVTDALFYFIGHSTPAPHKETRYLPVQGAHIIHMLRDWSEDCAAGYFNLPREIVATSGLAFDEVGSPAHQMWVRSRVKLAQHYFQAGRDYLSGARCLRRSLACLAYISRFEWMARVIERDGYRLRAAYPERKSLRAAAWMAWRMITSICGLRQLAVDPRELALPGLQHEER